MEPRYKVIAIQENSVEKAAQQLEWKVNDAIDEGWEIISEGFQMSISSSGTYNVYMAQTMKKVDW